MKTIKQIADELGVSKTAVRNKIENLGLSEKMETNGNRIEVNERQERLIKSAFSQKKSKTENVNKVSEKTETLRLLSDMISTLSLLGYRGLILSIHFLGKNPPKI